MSEEYNFRRRQVTYWNIGPRAEAEAAVAVQAPTPMATVRLATYNEYGKAGALAFEYDPPASKFYMTPAEAREYAAAVVALANKAEGAHFHSLGDAVDAFGMKLGERFISCPSDDCYAHLDRTLYPPELIGPKQTKRSRE